MTYKDQCRYYEKEVEELKAQIEQMQNSVREVLASEDTEVGQLMRIVGLGWYDKKYIENLVEENAELRTQVEQLKCCGNCEYSGGYFCPHETECDMKYSMWKQGARDKEKKTL